MGCSGGSREELCQIDTIPPMRYAAGYIGRITKKQGAPLRTHPEKSTYDRDMYNRAFPVGNALFLFAGSVMSLFRLPCSKLPLAFLAVPAGKDGWVECPCQTVDDFIGIGGSVCGLFLFVQTHAPLIVPPWQSRARKSKFHFYQAQGRGSLPPCTCGWWLIDGLQVPVVMRFLYRSAFLQTVPYTPCAA